MPEASCHCGAVRIAVPAAPEFVVDCNCSICHRNGALWAFYTADSIEMAGHPENTTAYIWGQRSIRTLRCSHCGCVTHWEPFDDSHGSKYGINTRNFDPAVVHGVRLRRFDGADTWTYLDP